MTKILKSSSYLHIQVNGVPPSPAASTASKDVNEKEAVNAEVSTEPPTEVIRLIISRERHDYSSLLTCLAPAFYN